MFRINTHRRQSRTEQDTALADAQHKLDVAREQAASARTLAVETAAEVIRAAGALGYMRGFSDAVALTTMEARDA